MRLSIHRNVRGFQAQIVTAILFFSVGFYGRGWLSQLDYVDLPEPRGDASSFDQIAQDFLTELREEQELVKEALSKVRELGGRCERRRPLVPANPYNLAICMYGSFRASEQTVSTFERYVYEHLSQPDLFMYLKPLKDQNMAALQDRMQKMATRVWLEDDMDYSVVRARGGYSPCLDRLDSRFNAGWPGVKPGSELHQLRGAEKCGEMVLAAEKARGRKYDRIIFTRTDHVYVGPHPLMDELKPRTTWIPTGEDWSGINDRSGVFTREHAEIRFKIHGQLLNGQFNCDTLPLGAGVNSEFFLNTLLTNHFILGEVSRYPSRSYIGCTERVSELCPGRTARYHQEQNMALEHKRQLGLRWAAIEVIEAAKRRRIQCA